MNDFKSEALESMGFIGSIDDMFRQYVVSKTGSYTSSERDFWRTYVPSSNDSLNDVKMQALTSLGYTQGSIGDRERLYWRGAVRGPEIVTNGDFSSGSTGWTLGTGWTVAGNQLIATAAEPNTFASTSAVVSGKTYEISIACTSITAGGWKLLLEGGANVVGDQITTGTFRAIILASTTGSLYVWANSLLTATFDNVSVREVIYP